MRLSLFPAMPNTRRVRELKHFAWDVEISGGRLSLGFEGTPLGAEAQLRTEPAGMQWLGDVLAISDRGEFVLAVNRGLVLSAECELLVLDEKKLDREERTVRVRTEAGHFLVYFEWGDELSYSGANEGRVGITSPGADWPLMLFIAMGPTPALAETEMDRLKSVDMGGVVALTSADWGPVPEAFTAATL